jgi:hypothetical protein
LRSGLPPEQQKCQRLTKPKLKPGDDDEQLGINNQKNVSVTPASLQIH